MSNKLQMDASTSDVYGKSAYSKMIRVGQRTYFIDAKQTRSNDHFLSITELRKKTEDSGVITERNKIHVYKEDFKVYMDGLYDVIDYIEQESAQGGEK